MRNAVEIHDMGGVVIRDRTMRTLIAVAILLLGWAAPVTAQSARTQQYEAVAQPGPADSTTESTDVRFKKDASQRMTVPVHVAGSGPYRFLIDTGADRTAISTDLARLLRLPAGARTTLHTVAGQSEIETADAPMLDLTAKRVRTINAALLDSKHMGADGIVGLDMLRSQRILFDFKRQTLTIVPSAVRVSDYDDAIVVTGRIRNGRFIVADARAENTNVTLVVDTGAEVSLGNDALRQKLKRGSNVKRFGAVELQSVAGETLLGEYLTIRELEIGGVTMKNLTVVFADTHAFGPLGLANKPALLLGMNALRGFEKVSIDFARRKLRVVLPQESSLRRNLLASR